MWVNHPLFSPSCNILDTSVLTHTQSVVILYVLLGLNDRKSSTLFLLFCHIGLEACISVHSSLILGIYDFFIFAIITSTYYIIYCVLCLCHFASPLELDIVALTTTKVIAAASYFLK